jgi:hypothetical protein
MRDQGKKNLIAKNETIEKAISFLKNDVDQRGLKKLGISLTPTTGDILINKMWGIYATNILQLHFVDWLDIVTNGILLDEDNVRIICNLPNMQKLNFSISVGGVDRETYQLMFGTDMFNKVRKNINHFMKELKDKNIKLNVAINLRVPDSKKISQEIINSTFNEVGYKWAHYSVLDEYKDVPENVDGKKILKMSNKISERSNIPCGMLDSGALNFTAEGRITACGCHYSQKLGDDSLVLGSVDAVLGEVNAKRLSLISDWRELNKIPQLCSTCQHYHVHDGLESNGLMLQRQIKNEPY